MNAPLDARALVGSHDILLMTIDTLRYDVAVEAHQRGETPFLSSLLRGGAWEKRHSPGSFTYAAHHAFFAGFLPTPARPRRHVRLFAPRFEGSETIGATTFVFDTPDIVSGLAREGYHTVCIGGVGFFNKRTPLGAVLPALFAESWWDESLGVTCPISTANQVRLAISRITEISPKRRLFLFVNISACHQPNRHYLPGAEQDSVQTQRAALAYVDRQLPPLFAVLRARAPLLAIILSDHGTAYGEDGYHGHRLAHPIVWEVPYMEAVLPQTEAGR
jgi:hypothetical protein